MSRKTMWIPISLFLLAKFALGCGQIPTDSDSKFSSADGRVYVNEEWGFQLTMPDDSTWSLRSGTDYLNRESNGLPRVNVRISKISLEGRRFQPTLSVNPRLVARGTTLETFVATLEEDLKASFIGYNAGEKQLLQLASAGAVEWIFHTAHLGRDGRPNLAAVVVQDRQGYIMLGR